MNIKLILSAYAIASIGAVAVLNAPQNIITASADSTYHCASIHFGMDDSTRTGNANLANSESIAVGSYEGSIGVVSGITMTNYQVINQAVNAHSNACLKMSSAKKNSTLVLTFSSSVIGCDVYAIGWKGDAVSLSINGEESAIASSDLITGTGTIQNAQYAKYSFSFEESNVLTIEATKRLIIGDIALRVK